MPLDAWRSTQSYPTNGLCARGFARELKLAVTGTVGDKPDYPLVERGFRDATGAELARATWHGWWHGQRLPNATYRTLVDNAFDGLARRWLFRSLKHDRLQAHFATLDLKWLAEHQPDDAQAQAWEVIRTLHQEWKPTPSGELGVASILDDPRPGRGKTGGSRPSRPGFGRPKGVPARLSVRSTELGVSSHEPLNPSSVLVFLIVVSRTRLQITAGFVRQSLTGE